MQTPLMYPKQGLIWSVSEDQERLSVKIAEVDVWIYQMYYMHTKGDRY